MAIEIVKGFTYYPCCLIVCIVKRPEETREKFFENYDAWGSGGAEKFASGLHILQYTEI